MKHVTISLTYEDDRFIYSVMENLVKKIRQGREKENYIEKGVEVVFQTFEIDTAKPDRETRNELINGKMNIVVKSNI